MVRLWLAAAAVLVGDQYTKHIVAATFAPHESRIAVPHALWWTYVQNRSGAFGLFGTQSWLLIVMALIVLGIFWYAFGDLARRSPLVRVAFGAILGGAISNIVDRLRLEYVVDFIDLHWWPVFNVADSCISVGVGLLVIVSMLRDKSVASAKS